MMILEEMWNSTAAFVAVSAISINLITQILKLIEFKFELSGGFINGLTLFMGVIAGVTWMQHAQVEFAEAMFWGIASAFASTGIYEALSRLFSGVDPFGKKTETSVPTDTEAEIKNLYATGNWTIVKLASAYDLTESQVERIVGR